MVECTGMASGMAESTRMAKDPTEMSESSGMPSGMAEAIGMHEATEMTEAIVTTRAC
jgi:hypothetical protein